MSIDAGNFRAWFEDVLASLYKQHDAGFAIVMIAFPILERYLRQKVKLSPEADLTNDFFDKLCTILSELPIDKARDFWSVYRNGILHQVTFSPKTKKLKPLPCGALSHQVARLKVDAGGFFLNPVAFAKRVTEVVKADFSTFEGVGGGSSPPLPQVYDIPLAGLTAVSGVASTVTGYVLGTAAPPPWKS